jgi:hypothetical protein
MDRVNASRGRPHWPVAALAAAGLVLAVAGVLVAIVPVHHETIPQWNGLCGSGAGQIGQFFDSSWQRDCGAAGFADHLIGWLLGGGTAAVAAAGLLWLARWPRSA